MEAYEGKCRHLSHRIARREMQPFTPAVPAWASAALCHSPPSPAAAREVRHNTAMRQARTCYAHLAGVAGVELLEALLGHGWLMPQDDRCPRYFLTPQGTAGLAARGLEISHLSKARRRMASGCLDWTERRPHLAGALGAAILVTLSTSGFICRVPGSRTVTILQPLTRWLDAVQGCSPVANLISSTADTHQPLQGFSGEGSLR
jgi:hypothetical protein